MRNEINPVHPGSILYTGDWLSLTHDFFGLFLHPGGLTLHFGSHRERVNFPGCRASSNGIFQATKGEDGVLVVEAVPTLGPFLI